MRYTLYEQEPFASVREELFQGDDNFRLFQDALMQQPRAGDVIPGTHGARKIRWNDPQRGKGKRGGIRVIYFFHEEMDRFLLLYAYSKKMVDISEEQKRGIGATIQEFRLWRETKREW